MPGRVWASAQRRRGADACHMAEQALRLTQGSGPSSRAPRAVIHCATPGNNPEAGLARLCQILVFRRVQIHPGHRVDPAQMVVNLLYPGNIFGADDSSLPRTLLGDDAAQVDDTVAHRDAEAEGAPGV